MTFTKENNVRNAPDIAGLAVILKSLKSANQPAALTHWLSEIKPSPVCVPLAKQNGVTKVMLVTQPQNYSGLTQTICQKIGWNTAISWQGHTYELSGVEVDTCDLHVLQVSLSSAEPLPSSMGRAIHAQFFHWLTIANPALAQQLHQQDQQSVYPGAPARFPPETAD